MYNLETKNYNVIIEDLDIILRKNNVVTITDEQYNSSKDLKKLLSYLKIEKVSDVTPKITETKISNLNESTILVRDGDLNINNSSAIMPDHIIEDEKNIVAMKAEITDSTAEIISKPAVKEPVTSEIKDTTPKSEVKTESKVTENNTKLENKVEPEKNIEEKEIKTETKTINIKEVVENKVDETKTDVSKNIKKNKDTK